MPSNLLTHLCCRGYVHLERMAPDKAENALAVASKKASHDRDFGLWKALSWSQLGQEKYEDAQASFARVLDIAPEEASASAGMELAKVGDSRVRRLGPGTLDLHYLDYRGSLRSSVDMLGRLVIAISPDDPAFVTGEIDGTIRLWDLVSGQVLRVIGLHKRHKVEGRFERAMSVASFSPDGRHLLVAGANGEMLLWKVGQPEGVHFRDSAVDIDVKAIAFSSDGRYALYAGVGSNYVLRRLDIDSGVKETIARTVDRITGVAVFPSGTLAAITTEYPGKHSGKVRQLIAESPLSIWDIKRGERLRDVPDLASSLERIWVTRDGACAVTRVGRGRDPRVGCAHPRMYPRRPTAVGEGCRDHSRRSWSCLRWTSVANLGCRERPLPAHVG